MLFLDYDAVPAVEENVGEMVINTKGSAFNSTNRQRIGSRRS